jgi:hypothetical protein
MWRKLVFAFILILLTFVSLAKATDVTNCMNITEPGTYTLINSLNGSLFPSCSSFSQSECEDHSYCYIPSEGFCSA